MTGVYSDGHAPADLVKCMDTFGRPLRATVSAGTTYYISVGSIAEPGALFLSAKEVPPPLTHFVVEPTAGTVTRSGLVTVSGTVTCDQPGTVTVVVWLHQLARRGEAARGVGSTSTRCGPTPGTWSVQISSETAMSFRRGSAGLTLDPYGHGDGGGSTMALIVDQPIFLARSRA